MDEVIECPCGCGYPMPAALGEEDIFDAGLVMERWAAEQGLTMAALWEDNRLTHMVEARRRVATYLRHHRWSYPRIGRFLHRDHTTIQNLLKNRRTGKGRFRGA